MRCQDDQLDGQDVADHFARLHVEGWSPCEAYERLQRRRWGWRVHLAKAGETPESCQHGTAVDRARLLR